MKKILVAVFLFTLAGFKYDDHAVSNCNIVNTCFADGENIGYKIYYSLGGVYFEAGEVNFKCKKENLGKKRVYHITAFGRTRSIYDHLYKVRDRYDTFIDTASLLSYHFIRSVLEGSTKKFEDVTFNREVNTAITDSGVFKIPDCTHDVLGALYYIRNISIENMKAGEKIEFQMILDNQVYKSYIRYVGKEVIITKYGKFRAIKIKPLLIKGTMFEAGEKMTVWVTDDKNHVPIRIQSNIRIGSVKADLMEFTGLRWPLSSLISH